MKLESPEYCSLCNPERERVLWKNDFVRVISVSDDAYPVFCRVITNQHWVEFSDLSPVDRERIMHVVYSVEKEMRILLSPTKVNIASFGNLVPHLHWHVIPRFQGDPHYPNPIWGDLTGGRPVSPPSGFWEIFGDSLRASLDNDRI